MSEYLLFFVNFKVVETSFHYPFFHLTSSDRMVSFQQRPSIIGIPRYLDSWHAATETARYEGVRGFYRGITSSLLKNIPSASITFVMYENILKLLKVAQKNWNFWTPCVAFRNFVPLNKQFAFFFNLIFKTSIFRLQIRRWSVCAVGCNFTQTQ